MNAPLIAVSTRVKDDQHDPKFIGVSQSYLDALVTSGAIPVFVPCIEGAGLVERIYQQCSGVLLIGGEDVDPSRYGEPAHPKLGKIDSLRDSHEMTLINHAWQDNKPILAICRGIQILNVTLGGTLYQDIPSQLPDACEHRESKGARAWHELKHELRLNSGSRLARLLGAESLRVNSLHHQALKDVSPLLAVVGQSEDGVIEAVEAHDQRFVIGVQCHPEMLWQETDTRWRKVFRAFVEASS